jgi:hypothetical protein
MISLRSQAPLLLQLTTLLFTWNFCAESAENYGDGNWHITSWLEVNYFIAMSCCPCCIIWLSPPIKPLAALPLVASPTAFIVASIFAIKYVQCELESLQKLQNGDVHFFRVPLKLNAHGVFVWNFHGLLMLIRRIQVFFLLIKAVILESCTIICRMMIS